MPNKLFVYPCKKGSASARVLASELGGKRIKLENSNYRQRASHVVVNWGSSSAPFTGDYLNKAENVGLASNKREFFINVLDAGKAEYCVPFAVSKEEASEWDKVVVRHKLTGHSGEGIEIVDTSSSELPDAPLYTKYVPKKDEYRIHLYRKEGEIHIFDRQRKAIRPEEDFNREDVNFQVRNHDNGFMYVRNGLAIPSCVDNAAKEIFSVTGLDFAALDVIYNEYRDQAYVLEVNTAPGLSGETTLNNYVEMIKNFMEQCYV